MQAYDFVESTPLMWINDDDTYGAPYCDLLMALTPVGIPPESDLLLLLKEERDVVVKDALVSLTAQVGAINERIDKLMEILGAGKAT